MKKVTIIIVDYKNKKDTIACIASLNSLNTKEISLSVVLVNNDINAEYKEKDFSSLYPLTVINSKINNGYAGGNNVGMKKALAEGAEYLLLLNSDTIVHKDLIKELLIVLDSDKTIGLVSPKIYFMKGSEFHKEKYEQNELGNVLWYAGGIMDWDNILGKHRGVDEVDKGQYDTVEQTQFATGCCLLVRSEVIKDMGLLDERYFLYYEDSDLNERMKRNSYTIMYAPKAMLWHKNAGSTGGSGSKLQDYYITRNRMLFGITYAPIRSKFALLKESLQMLIHGRDWQKIGVRDYFLGNFGKGSYQIP